MLKIAFNDGWVFYRFGQENCKSDVTLPHDAMLSEARSNCNPGGKNVAYFAGADYVYEKNFILPIDYSDKKIVFEFEGVYRNAEVYLNGQRVAFRPYGYINFYVYASEFLRFGEENQIKIIARNADQPNSRWYSGAGIYRPVWMYVSDKKHIALNGVKIRTLSINPARIEVKVKTEGAGEVEVVIAGEAKQAVATDGEASFTFNIPGAKLWDCDNPNLYKCKVVFAGDEEEVVFGIRQIELDAQNGFRLNGKRVILHGACIHHDNGLLGAVAHPYAEYRKIKILQENGYNAVRSAHNPCSKALLDACDRLGMLVLDEYVDMWYIHKTKYDYADYMTEWWPQDLADMVDKDYNRPSVIMYSIGNEVSETAQKRGIGLTVEMTEYLHKIDGTRPVTCGVNIFFNYLSSLGLGVHSNKKAAKESKKPKKDKAVGSEFFNNLAGLMGDKFMKWGATLRGSGRRTREAYAKLDAAGYNYGVWRYKKDVKRYPNRVILGSETFCADAYRFWEFAKKHPALIGDFVWAGIDYLGEVGIGSWVYRDYTPDFKGGAGWLTSGSGRIDITGKPLCEALYTKVAFEQEKLRIGVVPVNNATSPHSPSAWKFSNAVESWSWEGYEGRKTRVEVYARGYRVALFVNSVRVGSKKLKDSCICRFNVKYRCGQLLAISFDKSGKEIARTSLMTAGSDTKLTLIPESYDVISTEAKRSGEISIADNLCYIHLQYTDSEGIVKPLVRGKIKVSVQNGSLIGLGHACPYNPDGYLNDTTDTYFGEALAIIKLDGTAPVKVLAESPYGTAEAEIMR